MYKYKEKHDKMNMRLQLEQYRKLVMQYILVHWRLTIGTLTINDKVTYKSRQIFKKWYVTDSNAMFPKSDLTLIRH
jgi:hypothetical protein